MKSKLFILLGMILLIGSLGNISAGIYSSVAPTYYVSNDLNYSILTFTSNGSFNVTSNLNISILLIGGGGGGGTQGDTGGGGGGAGGLTYQNSYLLSSGNNNIIIGVGGVGGSPSNNGQNSSFSSLIVFGGGGGGYSTPTGLNGGSGGGGAGISAGGSNGGLGVVGQGKNGTGNCGINTGKYPAGGGGGAGVVGGCPPNNAHGGDGGNGLTSNIYNGTNLWYAGGGASGCFTSSGCTNGVGGSGGGGGVGAAGVDGTGSGGGSNSNGGTGIVIIRYLTDAGSNATVNSESHNALTYETISNELYSINITQNNTPTNAYLSYNGTNYSLTVTLTNSNTAGNYYTLSKTLANTASKIGSNSFYYIWNVSTTEIMSSSTYSQTISPIQFGLCNSTLTVPYLNISFKDEATEGFIKASIPSSTFLYYLGDGSITKTLTYSSTTTNYNYTFCGLPANQTYYINPYVQYKNTTEYPQRIYDPDLGTYTNATSNVTLYLLSSTDGIYTTFQVVNVAGQTINGVLVNAYKVSGGVPSFVATGITSSSGSVTFWLNPDYEHIVNFSKSGYSTYTFDEPPTQSIYTIILSSSTESVWDFRQGITISKSPTNDSLDENSTNDFKFIISSSYHTLDSFMASLYFGNGTLISSDSSTIGTGGTITFWDIHISDQSIYLNYNWTINSTTINGTFYWINSGTEGQEFSIWHFFTDLNLYISSGDGLFGIDNFGKGLLCIVFLVIIVGTVSSRYGIQSEVMIFGVIFGIVLFLDTMNFIPKPDFLGIVPLDNFLTIITGLLFVGFILKEEMR